MALLDSLSAIILPKGKGKRDGVAFTPDYNPRNAIMNAPAYRQHLTDLYATRASNDSRTLLNDLVNHDPDVSAAVHSYLTISASAHPVIIAYDAKGQVDPKGIELATRLLAIMTTTNDYTVGFSNKPTMHSLCNDLRYMALLRGTIAAELVLDKTYTPSELRIVDSSTLEWSQTKNGYYSPMQKPAGSNEKIDLNIPTFFTATFHQNPTSIYTYSPFVAAINTIAARQEVINELYRIMQIVGYPRLDISVVESVLTANAPTAFRTEPAKVRAFVDAELNKIRAAVSGLRSDQAFVHSDAVKAEIINDKNPSAGLQISQVIDVLDSQNQAALKVMPAVVGKGANMTVAGVEARLFGMSADALNWVVADLLSKALTLGARLAGYPGRIQVGFRPVELRPVLELEPQLTMRGSRLRQELSLGTISDVEYHMEMFGRPPAAGAPQLSGTGFLDKAKEEAAPGDGSVDVSKTSPNQDSLGRALTSKGAKAAKGNATKSGEV